MFARRHVPVAAHEPAGTEAQGGLAMGTSRIVAAGLVALGTGVATGLVALPSPAALPAPDLLVQGTVAQAAAPGPAAPVAGSEVRVSWIPGLAGADVGDELTPTTVAVVHTDAHGRYHVHVDPNPAMERA